MTTARRADLGWRVVVGGIPGRATSIIIAPSELDARALAQSLRQTALFPGTCAYVLPPNDSLVAVCASCYQPSCWDGDLLCEDAFVADVIDIPASVVARIAASR